MYISNATKEQTENSYFFKETHVTDFHFEPNAIAMVKDFEVWSYLMPAENKATENFKIFSFHFKDGLDNSGFVGWLANKIKEELGSGLFVVCGQNSNKGGIFDYWGCPVEVEEEVLNLIKNLQDKSVSTKPD